VRHPRLGKGSRPYSVDSKRTADIDRGRRAPGPRARSGRGTKNNRKKIRNTKTGEMSGTPTVGLRGLPRLKTTLTQGAESIPLLVRSPGSSPGSRRFKAEKFIVPSLAGACHARPIPRFKHFSPEATVNFNVKNPGRGHWSGPKTVPPPSRRHSES